MTSFLHTRRAAARKLGFLLAGSPLLASRKIPLDDLVNVFEVEEVARQRLSPELYDSVAAGSGAGVTLRRNREAFDRITLRPRVLVDVRQIDLSTRVFSQRLEAPLLVAPTSDHTRLHPEGEVATLRGAAAAKMVAVVSSRPGVPLERIVAQGKGSGFWCQVELEADAGAMRERVARVMDAGAQAICVSAGWPAAAPLDWAMLARLREWSKAPVWVKGILSSGEARLALERGAQGIMVSNHGGRLADGAPATMDVLAAVVESVGGRAPVIVDGGFRRGTDVLKALALGAHAVMVGRPPLWGLGAYGAEGVQKVLELLETELALAMGLCGRPNLSTIDRTLLKIHRRA